IGALAAGTTTTFTIHARVNSSTPPSGPTLTNRVTISSSTPETSPNVFLNSATAVTTVGARSADLSLVKSAAPSPVTPGTELTYTLTATNAGPSDAPSVSVTDTVPAGTTFVRVAQGTCATSGSITCTVGSLPP